MLGRWLVHLSRVVLHPSYRGAGLAAEFVRRTCAACPWPWIETLAEMGHLHPLFERAGFVKVGQSDVVRPSRAAHSALYGTRRNRHGQKQLVSPETYHKSRFAHPVYYIFDNRVRASTSTGEAQNSEQSPAAGDPRPDCQGGQSGGGLFTGGGLGHQVLSGVAEVPHVASSAGRGLSNHESECGIGAVSNGDERERHRADFVAEESTSPRLGDA